MRPIQLISATILLLAACKESEPTTKALPEETSSADKALIEKVLATAPAGEAKAIKEIKATAKPGDEVTLTGRIMGHEKPFVESRAAFILADPTLISPCSEDCQPVWDACGNTPEEIRKAIATIQIINADGRVLKQGLEGTGGLANLATLTVSGKVAVGSEGDILIVNAAAIKITPPDMVQSSNKQLP